MWVRLFVRRWMSFNCMKNRLIRVLQCVFSGLFFHALSVYAVNSNPVVTLGSWTSDSQYYTCTISVSGATGSSSYNLKFVPSSGLVGGISGTSIPLSGGAGSRSVSFSKTYLPIGSYNLVLNWQCTAGGVGSFYPENQQTWTGGVFTSGGVMYPTLGNFDLNGTTVNTIAPVLGYRTLTFTIHNSGITKRQAFVTCAELPNWGTAPVNVDPGANATVGIVVDKSDTYHYFMAFKDLAATLNANNFSFWVVDGVAQYRGLVYDSVDRTAMQVGSVDGIGVATTTQTGSTSVLPANINTPVGGTVAQTTSTGSAVAATNDQLAAVGNAIGKTVADIGNANQQAVVSGNAAVVSAVNQSGSDNSSAIVSAVNQSGNSIVSAINAEKDALKASIDALKPEAVDIPTIGDMGSAGRGAVDAASAALGIAPVAVNYTATSNAPDFNIRFPDLFGGGVVDVNPFRDDRFGPMITWFRIAMEWFVKVTLAVLVWSEIRMFVGGLSQIRQAVGNAAVGGTGAQATALIAAGIISTLVVVVVSSLVAWGFGMVSVTSLMVNLGMNPLQGIPGYIYFMLNACFPVALMLTCFVAKVSLKFYASSLFLGVSALIRFVVP